MISPRSFIYSRHPRPSSTSPLPSSSPAGPASHSSPLQHCILADDKLAAHAGLPSHPTTIDNKASNSVPRRISAPNYDQRKSPTDISIAPIRSPSPLSTSLYIDATMGKRKDRFEATGLPPASQPREATAKVTRPSTPSSPVQIPKNSKRTSAHSQKRHTSQHRKPRHAQSPDDISPSMAALLAVTDIPRQRSQRRRRRSDKPLTVDEVVDDQQVSEKELSWSLNRSLSRGPMDMLLSPPGEYADDDVSVSDCNIGSALSTRTISADSIPSLGDSFATDGVSSLETPGSPSPSFRGRRLSPMRKSLEPVLSPPGEEDDHPLARRSHALEEPSTTNPDPPTAQEEPMSLLLGQFKPLKYAFRSNLTASFRALRSAAKSFSNINFSSIPSDDLLTRSLLTIDPNVPYADERRPPVSEDIPSAEMRRYLNPTTTSRLESQLASVPPPGTFSASIQMQTYKVQRSKQGSTRDQLPRSSPQPTSQAPPPSEPQTAHSMPPGMRQREMRENSDFIRIAVMEMAMRKRGKLDDQRPGRARWALPPRRTSTTPYEIGPNGVPARWRSSSY